MKFFKQKVALRSGEFARPFLVVIHDVCPLYSNEIQVILAALEPFLDRNISAAVVPNWHGVLFDAEDVFTQKITRGFGEILLHGWTHQRESGRGMIAYFTRNCDEFAGLSLDETNERLQLGHAQLNKVFGRRVCGFLPPAWQRGCIDRNLLDRHQLKYLLGYLAIEFVDGRRIPLSTVTWDVGRFACLSVAAEMLGHTFVCFRRHSVRSLALHPIDVSHGHLPRIVRTVEAWLRSGGTPVLPCDLLYTGFEESQS